MSIVIPYSTLLYERRLFSRNSY